MKCWIVTEGITAMENQCLGAAERLTATPEIKRIGLRQPWKTLSPFLHMESALTFTGDKLTAPWPDVAIGCGRKAVAALRYIKKASGGQTLTVYVQNPKADTHDFDFVAIPVHDGRTGDNVIVTEGAPNHLTARHLEDGRADWRPVFEKLPAPRVAVLIGGNSNAHTLSPENVKTLTAHLRTLAEQGHGVMITMSRRTGADNTTAIRLALDGSGAWIWDGPDNNGGPNPYPGMLGWADYIVVTSDSVSMISEAATTGKPVYVMPLEGGNDRFNKLYDNLLSKGVIRMFEGQLVPYAYEPLDDSRRIADAITRKMAV